MKQFLLLASLASSLCVAGYADILPVIGSTTGTYLTGSATTGTASGTTWTFGAGANASTIVYDSGGTSFNGNTALDINLGSLTLSNGGNGGLSPGSYSAELDLTVAFTTPVGSVVLLDLLNLTIDNGSNGFKLLLSGLPVESFTVGSTTYTVTLDGLYDAASGGNLLSSGLSVDNPGSGSSDPTIGTAYLRGTVTAGSDIIPTSAVPEPGSISLLFTALGGVAFSLRRKIKPQS
jgi:hypothetical protein